MYTGLALAFRRFLAWRVRVRSARRAAVAAGLTPVSDLDRQDHEATKNHEDTRDEESFSGPHDLIPIFVSFGVVCISCLRVNALANRSLEPDAPTTALPADRRPERKSPGGGAGDVALRQTEVGAVEQVEHVPRSVALKRC